MLPFSTPPGAASGTRRTRVCGHRSCEAPPPGSRTVAGCYSFSVRSFRESPTTTTTCDASTVEGSGRRHGRFGTFGLRCEWERPIRCPFGDGEVEPGAAPFPAWDEHKGTRSAPGRCTTPGAEGLCTPREKAPRRNPRARTTKREDPPVREAGARSEVRATKPCGPGTPRKGAGRINGQGTLPQPSALSDIPIPSGTAGSVDANRPTRSPKTRRDCRRT